MKREQSAVPGKPQRNLHKAAENDDEAQPEPRGTHVGSLQYRQLLKQTSQEHVLVVTGIDKMFTQQQQQQKQQSCLGLRLKPHACQSLEHVLSMNKQNNVGLSTHPCLTLLARTFKEVCTLIFHSRTGCQVALVAPDRQKETQKKQSYLVK